jgi:hypothetical protein
MFLYFQEEADRKRRTEFKRYEMEKKFEHEQVTKQFIYCEKLQSLAYNQKWLTL